MVDPPVFDQIRRCSSVDEEDESSSDSMVCDAGSRLVQNGFTKLNCPEEVVMFVNAGGEALTGAEATPNIVGDTFFQGGDVLRTNECICQGGDYPFIYQSARVGTFCYRFENLSPGQYFVDLHFAEIINTNGPKGMRIFNVFVQEEKVLSDFDIFSIVGANKPVQLVDFRVSIKEDGMLMLRFEGVHGSPVINGICLRRAPKVSVPPAEHEYLVCNNCTAEIEVPSAQKKWMQTKAIVKYEKRIQELTLQCQQKTDECYEAWMSLNATNEQMEKVRMELDNRRFQAYSQDQVMEKQAAKLENLSSRYERDKSFWVAAVNDLDNKIKIMKQEQSQLSHAAHDCADSVPELNKMVFAVQALVIQCEDLKMKYCQEQEKRKKLYNQVQEARGNIRVFCRCRPLSKEETLAGHATVVDLDAAKDGDLGILTGGSTKKLFKFDRVYTPRDDQVDVFADASPMVVSVLDGYNVCIFAYGQTGTGKTFTMEGTEQNRGVNYRTLEELFQIADKRSDTHTYNISVSVLEVYNEQIRDLLATSPASKKLEVKQASEGSHHVPGIVEAKVENIKEVWNVLRTGSNARVVGSNNVNEHSSRSHCMLCIVVRAQNLMNGECTKSKLWLVDLAGSERIGKTDAQGERLKEAQNINRSLSALGDVISALANKSSHIPYRNSKLTHLLQDSLGGDAKTLMFVQISPSEKDLGETTSSLNFATRVRGVELSPAKKQIDTGEIQKMKAMLDKARQECKSKDESLRKLEESLQNTESKTRSKDQIHKIQQDKIRELEGQLELKATFHNQSEKKVSVLSEKLRTREETCAALEHKIKELENKFREREHSESAAFQQKISYLENKLKEQVQESESHSLVLQNKVKELERKLKEQEQSSEFFLLHQKIKNLEAQLLEQEQEQEPEHLNFVDASKVAATPVERKSPPPVEDEGWSVSGTESNILRSSNSINHPTGPASILLKGNNDPAGTGNGGRKQEYLRNTQIGNMALRASVKENNRARLSDSVKSVGSIGLRTGTARIAKPVAAVQRPSSSHGRIAQGGIKDTKDNKKKVWNR